MRVTIIKRFFMMFLVAWITFISVFGAYKQTTYCAEWVAGAVAAVGGGPMLTALLIGGVVVAGGIAIYEISQTDTEDYRNFYNGIKSGFNEFVTEQETIIAKEEDSSLSDQEASDIGVQKARETVNNFFDNTIDGVKTTTQNLTKKAQAYWDLYSTIINDVADNGIDNTSGDIGIGTVLNENAVSGYDISNYLTWTAQLETKIDQYNELLTYQDHQYIYKGRYFYSDSKGIQVSTPVTNTNQNYLPFIGINFFTNGCTCNLYRYEFNSGVVRGMSGTHTYYFNTFAPTDQYARMSDLIRDVNMSDFPIVYGNISFTSTSNTVNQEIASNIVKFLAVGGSTAAIPIWKRTINSTLNDTHFGKSISTGRRAIVNNGDYIGGIFEDSGEDQYTPVKKSSLSVTDGVVTGKVGWDIPNDDTWDDVISGNRPYRDVVGGTGAVGIPDDDITGEKERGTEVEYPQETEVKDTADYPKDAGSEGHEKPQEIPTKPQGEIFENQGGNFYPTAFDLTGIFPFCIPFDVIYLVEKFDASGENAPVITIPIIYPSAIQSVMGTDRYDVVIDFQDFIVVRNVIRVFLLLLFIAGLMKVTRDLIRG